MKSLSKTGSDVQYISKTKPLAREPLSQRFSLDVLHDDVLSAGFDSNIMERANAGMRHSRNRRGLTIKSALPVRIFGTRLAENLDCDGTMKPRIDRSVNFAHSTCADGRDELIGSEARADGDGHRSSRIHRRSRSAFRRRALLLHESARCRPSM